MADSRNASLRYMRRVQRIVDIQRRIIYFLTSIIFSFGLTYFIITPDLSQDQVYVLFLLFLSIGLWITEAVPPFTVGLLIFGFLVFALGGYYQHMGENGAKYIQKYVQTWSNSVIWLMLGGFFLAEGMQKVGLDKILFKIAISKFGTKPRYVLLGIMLVTAVFSMIMSNTATTAMMIAAIIPFLNTLDKDAPFAKAMLIGIPAAASLGGMGTIIGSPPNAIAVEALSQHGISFGFLEWMMVGFPIAIIMVLLMWFFLIKRYIPKVATIDLSFLDDFGNPEDNSPLYDMKRKFVAGILIITLLLWLTGRIHHIPASAVSFIPIMMLTMIRIISAQDVRRLPWDTLMLVAGGLSLGLAIKETGLAAYYVGMIRTFHLNFYLLVVVFSFLTVIFSNFMSNTATTTILIPIAIILASQNPIILPIVIGLSASTALFLPISTPPNAIAFSTGKIEQKDFRYGGIIAGVLGPIVIIAIVLVVEMFIV